MESKIAEMLESRKARERERKRQGRTKIDVRFAIGGEKLPYYVNSKNQKVYLRKANPDEQDDAPFIDRLSTNLYFPKERIINRSLNFLTNKFLFGTG